MARLKKALHAEGTTHDKLGLSSGAMADLTKGGMNGHMPQLHEYNANGAYVARSIIPILVEAPRGFQKLDNPENMVAILKALMEEHSKSIEGLNSTLSVEYAETAVGGSGEMQEDPTNVTRARSTPTHVMPEKKGYAIGTFMEYWITQLIMNPETKVPDVVAAGNTKPEELTPEFMSMSMLYIEPDETHQRVVSAWLCTNMMPKSGGERTGKRDLTAAGEAKEHSFEFTALTQVGSVVVDMAQKILDEMTLTGVNPHYRKELMVERDSAVNKAATGYKDAIKDGTFIGS